MSKAVWRRGKAIAAMLLAIAASSSIAQTLILVRHAEKAAAPADDPPLTPAGSLRAESLAAALGGAKIDLVITSSLLRTKQTAAPIVAASHAAVKVVPIGTDAKAHVAAIAAAVKAMPKDAVILIVGHSNTVPMIAAALGVVTMIEVPDCAFDRMFVLTLGRSPPSLVAARYGVPSACAG